MASIRRDQIRRAIKKARKAGFVLLQGVTFQGGKRCLCPLGAAAWSCGYDGYDDIVDVADKLDIPLEFAYGFAAGFDGETGETDRGDYGKGWRLGKKIADEFAMEIGVKP